MALNSVVISDSTTLISLLNIERFELLFKFSDKIIITPAVYSEVNFMALAITLGNQFPLAICHRIRIPAFNAGL